MSIISRMMVLIIDRVKKSPQKTALLIHAIGGDPHGVSESAYNGLAILHLIKLDVIDVTDENGQSCAHEIELLSKQSDDHNQVLGFTIFNIIIKNGTLWKVTFKSKFFYLESMLGFSIRASCKIIGETGLRWAM
jgi:hypothetical protein